MNSADLADDEPTATQIHDAEVPQQAQNIQLADVLLSPKDKPTNCPGISNLSEVEFNRALQETLAYFKGKVVRIPDGRKGIVVGVDPRPMKGVPTSSGADGNYLVVQIARRTKPFIPQYETVWFMPDDLMVVESFKGKEIKT